MAGVASEFLVVFSGALFGIEDMTYDGSTVFCFIFFAMGLVFLSWHFKKISDWAYV
ncbi:hypothetical protein [Priestia megaterium]|uniref:hypothetical protein n=1 Tax=Priestia megaterium TaxID=1404 RepID=UPI000AE054FC|nr:hypothetical protein [Priestia megaterium]